MKSHGKKIMLNSIMGISYKIIILLIGFISRKLFIVYMGEELLGLNALFTDLLSLLNLADLGIGVSVQFSLYKPIAENDEKRIKSIVWNAKKVFEKIGIAIMAVGLFMTLFLDFFIAENPYSDTFLRIVFFMNVLSISLTYFVAHKKLFLQAKEEIYITNLIDTFAQIAGTVLKIVVIIVYKNYYMFVAISIACVAISNICIKYICDKKYPFLNGEVEIAKSDREDLFRNLKDVIPLKLGTYLYTSTDNVIISKFLGLGSVAIYSNYMLITNSIMQFFYMIAEAFKVSFGNAFHENRSKESMIEYFEGYLFLQFIISSFCAVALWCLMTPFVQIVFGKKYVMQNAVVAIIVIDMFVHSMYQPLSMIFGALGKFKEDKIITLGIDVVNIVVSVILVFKWGLLGPIAGTLLSNLLTWVFRGYQIVYKEFQMDIPGFMKKVFSYGVLCAIEVTVTSYICDMFFGRINIAGFIGRCMLCILIPNIINIIIWHRTKEFQMLLNRVHKVLPF